MRKEHLLIFQKQRLFLPLMLHIFKIQVVNPIHNIETHLYGKFQPSKDFFTHFMIILMISHIFFNLDFLHSKKKHVPIYPALLAIKAPHSYAKLERVSIQMNLIIQHCETNETIIVFELSNVHWDQWIIPQHF